MTPEQQLIQQIQSVLGSVQLERNPALEDLALQFSEMCEAANARLARCMDYLDKGMRSEAIHEAHSTPDLLELATLLQFDGIKKWRNLCADFEMSVFQPLHEAQLERLREAAEQEKELEPLLKEYRRTVYQGDKRRCIELLRKIRANDAANPSWEINLRPLEEDELQGWIQKAEIALAGGDLNEIGAVYSELNHPQRVVKAPEVLLGRMRRRLMSKEAARLKQEGGQLVERLKKAIAASDDVEIDMALSKMESIASQEAFLDKPDGWDESQEKAAEWRKAKKLHEEQQTKFLEEVEEFQQMLSHGKFSEVELRQSWERLQRWELPVSELLKKQVEDILEEKERRARRRERLIVLVMLVMLLGGLAAGVIVAYKKYHKAQVQEAIGHLQGLKDEKKYKEFLIFYENITGQFPELVQDEECQIMRSDVQTILKREEEQDAQYRQLWGQLAAIREKEYAGTPNERILQLLKDTGAVAKTIGDNNKVEAVNSWQQEWKDWQARRIRNANDIVNGAIAKAAQALNEQKAHPYATFEEVAAKLAELRKGLADVEGTLPLADDATRRAHASVKEQLNSWERTAKDKDNAEKAYANEIRQLKNDIASLGGNLDRYRASLERYVAIAQNNDPLKREYRTVLDSFGIYKEAAALGSRTFSVPFSENDKDNATTLLQKGGLAGTMWAVELQKVGNYVDCQTALSQRIMNLVAWNQELMELYYLLYRPKGGSEWRRLYSKNILMSSVDKEDSDIKRYWGMVYHWTESDPKPILMHTKHVFSENEFSTKWYDIQMKSRKEDNRAEFGKFVTSFVVDASDEKEILSYLISGIEKIDAKKDVETPLKALFIKQVCQLLADVYGGLLPELQELRLMWDNVNTNVSWMNPDDGEVKALSEKYPKLFAETRAKLTVLPEKLRRNMVVTKWILECNVQPVGSLEKNAQGQCQLRINVGNPSEIWGVQRVASSGTPVFYVISNDGKTLRADAERHCVPGMPVFAPNNGHGVLDAKFDHSGARPLPWPENAW